MKKRKHFAITVASLVLTVVLYFSPAQLLASSAMGGIGELGVLIVKAFIVCTIIEICLLITYFFGLKKHKIKNKWIRIFLYTIIILFNLIYIPFLLWAIWELLLE